MIYHYVNQNSISGLSLFELVSFKQMITIQLNATKTSEEIKQKIRTINLKEKSSNQKKESW